MDRRELLDRAARDEDERLLLGRVWDKWEQCRLRSINCDPAILCLRCAVHLIGLALVSYL